MSFLTFEITVTTTWPRRINCTENKKDRRQRHVTKKKKTKTKNKKKKRKKKKTKNETPEEAELSRGENFPRLTFSHSVPSLSVQYDKSAKICFKGHRLPRIQATFVTFHRSTKHTPEMYIHRRGNTASFKPYGRQFMYIEAGRTLPSSAKLLHLWNFERSKNERSFKAKIVRVTCHHHQQLSKRLIKKQCSFLPDPATRSTASLQLFLY